MSILIYESAQSLREGVERVKNKGHKVGFVPTMGALHEGHLSLVRLAARHADKVVVSIYVNPTQFAPHEDFDAYPRDFEDDLKKLAAEKVDIIYRPDQDDIYPHGPEVEVQAGEAGEGLDADFRPHFFHGVATVVHKLFELVQPDIAVFGRKDFQQLQVIREMVESENLPIQIVGGPIARDAHGLALSSRNAYLSEEELGIARMLNQIIYKAAEEIGVGLDADEACQKATDALLTAGFDKVDYVSFKPEWNRVLAAGWVGKTRLIDNCGVK